MDFISLRRHARKKFSGSVVLFYNDQSTLCEAQEISEGGMSVITEFNLAMGAPVTVHFVMEGSYVRGKGTIIYILNASNSSNTPEDKKTNKVGIRFDSIDDAHAQAIRRYTSDDTK